MEITSSTFPLWIPPECGCFDNIEAILSKTHLDGCVEHLNTGSYQIVHYMVGPPVFVGQISPPREELKVPYVYSCYSGTEVYHLPPDFDYHTDKLAADFSETAEPIIVENGLQVGDRILFWDWIGEIKQDHTGVLFAQSPKGTRGSLVWDGDDRHCWTCTGVMSSGAAKKMLSHLVAK